jgi:hypothetical protein
MYYDLMREVVGFQMVFIEWAVFGLGFEAKARVNVGRWNWEVIDG